MYSSYEIPLFSTGIMYFDKTYSASLSQNVTAILLKNGFFPPSLINAGPLTRNRYLRYKPQMEGYLTRCYTEKGITSVSMGNAITKKSKEFWHFRWSFTFYKFPKLQSQPSFEPWNVISLDTTYDNLRDPDFCKRYFNCVEELIALVHPFYAKIDDQAMSCTLGLLPSGNGSEGLQYGKIKAVYWGNYFGPAYCKQFELLQNAFPDGVNWKVLADGVLFYLSDSPWDLAGKDVFKKRKALSSIIKIAAPSISQQELTEINNMLFCFRQTGKWGKNRV